MAEDEKGVWRTIRGRKVFIKEGQSLADAMRESGKFEGEPADNKTSVKAKFSDRIVVPVGEKKGGIFVDKTGKRHIVSEEDDEPKATTKNAKSDEWKNDLRPRGQRKLPKGMTREHFIQQELKTTEEKALGYKKAIDTYSDAKFAFIRAFQRGEEVEDFEKIKKFSEDLEEYIKKAPRWNGGETFRGVGLTEEELKRYFKGYKCDMLGVASWSDKVEKAQKFADRNTHQNGKKKVIFRCRTQSKGSGVAHLSQFPEESEVLVSKDAKYCVTKSEVVGDTTYIDLEEIE